MPRQLGYAGGLLSTSARNFAGKTAAAVGGSAGSLLLVHVGT